MFETLEDKGLRAFGYRIQKVGGGLGGKLVLSFGRRVATSSWLWWCRDVESDCYGTGCPVIVAVAVAVVDDDVLVMKVVSLLLSDVVVDHLGLVAVDGQNPIMEVRFITRETGERTF